MVSESRRSDQRTLVRRPLAACIAALVFAATLPVDASATDTSWIRVRSDASRRIFPQLPLPRMAPANRSPATVTVGHCGDDGPGSLRDTIRNAADGSTIDLSHLQCSVITLSTGAIEIPVDSLTLVGRGRGVQVIDGNHADRVFLHPHGGALTFQSLTIRNGRNRETGFDVAGGGCIASAGYLTLDDADVTGCYAGGEGAYGGGIYAYSLTMNNSTLSDNVANGVHPSAGTAAFGGGAFVYSMSLESSTISGNRAVHEANGRSSYDIGGALVTVVGGGILDSTIDSNYSQQRGGGIAAFNPVSVANSTISGNSAAGGIGGGFLMRWPSTIELDSVTVTRNHANGGGGGVWIGIAGSLMNSSIVAGNTSTMDTFANLETDAPTAIVIAGDHNLVGDSNPGIVLPDNTINVDPQLAPLALNGGATRTHALLAGSPAIDAGTNPAGSEFDQRGSGYPRIQGAAPDIGAFESQPALPGADTRAVPTLSGWAAAVLATLVGMLAIARNRPRTPLRATDRPH